MHPIASADRTDMDIIAPDLFQNFIHRKAGKHRLKLLTALDFEDNPQIFLLASVVQKSIVADFLKTRR